MVYRKMKNGQRKTKKNGGKACRKEILHRRAWGRAKMRTAGGEVGSRDAFRLLFTFLDQHRQRKPNATTISIRGDSYRLKDKLKSGVVKPTTAGA